MKAALDISILIVAVYFLAEVPLLLASVAIYRRRRVRSELTPCAGMAQ